MTDNEYRKKSDELTNLRIECRKMSANNESVEEKLVKMYSIDTELKKHDESIGTTTDDKWMRDKYLKSDKIGFFKSIRKTFKKYFYWLG